MPIHAVKSPDALNEARRLFRAYAHELDVDLCFQDFEEELQALPGPYAAPDGIILLAYPNDTGAKKAIGCIALKPLEDNRICEMKRLYVAPEARGEGWGRALSEGVLTAARERNYDLMRLDTLASLQAARALYRTLGFKRISAYYDNPLSDVIYMEKSLT